MFTKYPPPRYKLSMCGIIGFFDTSGKWQGGAAARIGGAMTQRVSHRGPDGEGIWQDGALLLGHRRLSILDLSPEGHQPMASGSGRYIIVFNGEIYNFQELSRELTARGAHFRGRSDTEIMLAAFDAWGVNQALQKMHGMFAFALWDKQERVLHFVRDRLGKKPLYIGWAGASLVFGSELKSLRAPSGFRAGREPRCAGVIYALRLRARAIQYLSGRLAAFAGMPDHGAARRPRARP